MKPKITITYCTLCNWLLRGGWMTREFLSSFGEDLGQVMLVPAHGGTFTITADGQVIWDRTIDGGFPDAKEMKRRVRDQVWPDRNLGHMDRESEKP